VPGSYDLKCQVLSELGRCQRYLARPKLEILAYERGLQMCISGQKSAERCLCRITNDLRCSASSESDLSPVHIKIIMSSAGCTGFTSINGKRTFVSALWTYM